MQKDITQEAELEWFECLPFKEKVLVRVQVLSKFFVFYLF